MTSKQCSKALKSGKQCSRSPEVGAEFCWQHGEKKEKVKDSENKSSETKSSTFTITFGDRAENHKGMQLIGEENKESFTVDDLKEFQKKFSNSELIDLDPESKYEPAAILIIRNGVDLFLSSDSTNFLFEEHNKLDHDKKAFMYGRVVNKHARYNLCFADFSQEPDYKEGKGRVINFTKLPLTKKLREVFPQLLNSKADNLVAEGNYYYDINKCFIGWHGDTERKIVIAVRLGASFPLSYQWYLQNKPVGERINLLLNHGDIYIMSGKAVGFDWKSRSKYTLRHAASLHDKLIS